MKVLILEDIPERQECLFKQYKQLALERSSDYWDIKIVVKVDACIEILKKQQFDFISLDYDLADFKSGMQMSVEGTGAEVAEWIAVNVLPGPMIVIHSQNLDGAWRIWDILHRAGHTIIMFPFDTNRGPFS